MDVSIFETRNLGFVIAEIESVVGGDFKVRNPRNILIYHNPHPTVPNQYELKISLNPIMFKEAMADGVDDYKTTFRKEDYTVVEGVFKKEIYDMYKEVEGRVDEEDEEDTEVVLFDDSVEG